MKTLFSISLMIFLILTIHLPDTFAQEHRHTTLTGHVGTVSSVAFNPADGSLLASGSDDNTIRLWNTITGEHIKTLTGHTRPVSSVAFNPADGSLLASGSDDNTIRLWNTITGEHIKTLTGHTRPVSSNVAFSPDGSLLASGSDDNTIRLWDGTTGEHIKTLTGHTEGVLSLAFSPDGSLLASGGGDNTIRLWDGTTGEHIKTLTGHTDIVWSVAFSPDGSLLASGTWDNTIRLWDGTTGEHIKTLTGHTEGILSVAFNPADGSLLTSGSGDGTIHLWDTTTGEHIRTLIGHTEIVWSVAFSPDGSLLASGSDDFTVRLWDISSLINIPIHVNINPSPVESPAIGEHLTLNLNIAGGKAVAGYQATVQFDASALRYVDSSKGDYLPADAFFAPPKVEENRVQLTSTSLTGESEGDGILAKLIFEVVEVKTSTLILSEVTLSDRTGKLSFPLLENGQVVKHSQIPGDVNRDGVVNIQDLVFVASFFGQPYKKDADINGDNVVNIADLVLVANALSDAAAAPVAHPEVLDMLTIADLQQWLIQAQGLDITDATLQRGILFLEQLLAALTPKETALFANYPNPFNPETWIPYQLAKPVDVTLTIYGIDGQIVRQLALGPQAAGVYENRSRAAYWDGTNELGEPVASGLYFYTLTAGDFTATRKMLIRK